MFDFQDDTVAGVCVDETANAIPDYLDRNWQTTTAIGLGVATGGIGAAMMLAALPAQTLAASATIGGLAYAGHRRHQGLEPIPFIKKKDAPQPEAA